MRLALSINGTPRVTASLSAPGYLSAHLNMEDRPKESSQSKAVGITGILTRETETVHMRWPRYDLTTGDVVELRVLPDGEGDSPSSIDKSSEAAHTLLSSTNLAGELLRTVSDFEARLMQLAKLSEKTEPSEEHTKLSRAIGAVLTELGDRLLYPVYRGHKDLVPDELKGELL